MKYANIKFDGNRKGSVNIGDDLQLIAIEHLYRYMGIDYDNVVRIGLSELSEYSGEYVILPIAFPLYGYREGTYITMFSSRIIPVFLALSIMSSNISEEECVYLRRYEPIGCRDYHTVSILRDHNIQAYLNGCLTITLPRQARRSGEDKKNYLVDVPRRYYPFIPQEILSDSVSLSQILDSCDEPEKTIRDRLIEYHKHARLVITTRLHCALPCVAMGIPVVFMKDHFSFRFPTLSRYIHPYTIDEFDDIDWNPIPVDIEREKRSILEVAKRRVLETYEKYSFMYDLSAFYERDNIPTDYYIEHFDNVVSEVDLFVKSKKDIKYGIWGITQKSDMICDYIEHNYPGCKLSVVYDRDKRIMFHGMLSTQDRTRLIRETDFVVVATATANDEAICFFGKNRYSNFIISDDLR